MWNDEREGVRSPAAARLIGAGLVVGGAVGLVVFGVHAWAGEAVTTIDPFGVVRVGDGLLLSALGPVFGAWMLMFPDSVRFGGHHHHD